MRRWVPVLVGVSVQVTTLSEILGVPRVRQRLVRLDCLDLTVDSAPVCAED